MKTKDKEFDERDEDLRPIDWGNPPDDPLELLIWAEEQAEAEAKAKAESDKD